MARAATITKNNPRDLRLVTAGQGISLIGDSINQLALPLMAVDLLGADSFGTGALGAASTLAYLFIGLQAGVWVDRASRRAFLLAADAARVLLLLAIPLAYFLNLLTLPMLIAIQVGLGAATVFFNVAWPAYLPRLASGLTLLKLNARMAIMGEGAGFVGPGLAGALGAGAAGRRGPLPRVARRAAAGAAGRPVRAHGGVGGGRVAGKA